MSSPVNRVLVIDGGPGPDRGEAAAGALDGRGGPGSVRVASLAEAVEWLGASRFDAVVIAPPSPCARALGAAVGRVRARAPGIPIIVAGDPDGPAASGVPARARPSALIDVERERRRTGRPRCRAAAAPSEGWAGCAGADARPGDAIPAAVLAIEFDRFGHVAARTGAAVADRLLRAAAGRLRAALDPCDALVRRGGCGFAALLGPPRRPEDAGAVAAALLRDLARPFHLDGLAVHLTASIGVAVPPAGGGVALAALLEDAEGAMLVAVAGGGGRCVHRPPRAVPPRPPRRAAAAAP